jgi:hypothetical protein
MVSPPDKHGAQLIPIPGEGGLIQASEDGSAISYLSRSPIATDVAGNGSEFPQVLSRRTAGVGWSSQDISVREEAASGESGGSGTEYRLFAADLSRALVEQVGDDETPLSPDATERTPYRRDNATGSFEALLTTANVPPNTKYAMPLGSRSFEDASPDMSHVVLTSFVGLTPTPVPANSESLYEWANGTLQLVSLLPNGTAGGPARLGDDDRNVRHAISNDGTRIFWARETGQGRRLYVRDTAKGQTVQLDAAPAQGTPEPAEAKAIFQTASADGSKVFFTDNQKLTPDSTAGGGEQNDLYECELVEEAGKLACRLSDLTVDDNTGESAAVQGVVLGASEDGSYVYFVADGALAANSTPGSCVKASSPTAGATCNLYVRHAGKTRLIASLSSDDRPDWLREAESIGANLTKVTSRVSPSGRYLAFMSNRSLTGYDNTDVNSGQADEEVYLYDATAETLVCASCAPTGARPLGVLDTPESNLVDRAGAWRERWLAASLPGWTPVDTRHALYQSRYLSDSGRLFFNSPGALVPQDTNGKEDVYQYEPTGVGTCVVSSPTFSGSSHGCVDLISSGTSGQESAFLDASMSGNDAFFLTSAQLVPQDVDGSFDVYDAHVCTAATPCPAPEPGVPPCGTGDTCRSAPPAQLTSFGSVASEELSGSGNVRQMTSDARPVSRAQLLRKAVRACRSLKNRRRRAACESLARRRYQARSRKVSKSASPKARHGTGSR